MDLREVNCHPGAFEKAGGVLPSTSLLSLIAATLLSLALPAQGQELPEGKGKDLVAAHCNSCHPFYARLGAGYTAKGWSTVMRMMANHGVTLPADQTATITEYLTKNFPEKVTEWPSPSGPKSEPYGISTINDIIWYSESGTTPNTVVRFEPQSEKFQSWALPGGGNIVRNTSVTRAGDFVLANSLVNAVTLVKISK
jgi:hypothetical protein